MHVFQTDDPRFCSSVRCVPRQSIRLSNSMGKLSDLAEICRKLLNFSVQNSDRELSGVEKCRDISKFDKSSAYSIYLLIFNTTSHRNSVLGNPTTFDRNLSGIFGSNRIISNGFALDSIYSSNFEHTWSCILCKNRTFYGFDSRSVPVFFRVSI